MNDIKAVLFDLDGTLLDSMFVWQYVDEEFLRRRGITPPMITAGNAVTALFTKQHCTQ